MKSYNYFLTLVLILLLIVPSAFGYFFRTAATDGYLFANNQSIEFLNPSQITYLDDSKEGIPFAEFNLPSNTLVEITHEFPDYITDTDDLFFDSNLPSCDGHCTFVTNDFQTVCELTAVGDYFCRVTDQLTNQFISFRYDKEHPQYGEVIHFLNPLQPNFVTTTTTTLPGQDYPHIVAVLPSKSTVQILFDRTLDISTALNKNNYQINKGISVLDVLIDSQGKTVSLLISPDHEPGATYELTIRNIKDTNGNEMPGTTVEYTYLPNTTTTTTTTSTTSSTTSTTTTSSSTTTNGGGGGGGGGSSSKSVTKFSISFVNINNNQPIQPSISFPVTVELQNLRNNFVDDIEISFDIDEANFHKKFIANLKDEKEKKKFELVIPAIDQGRHVLEITAKTEDFSDSIKEGFLVLAAPLDLPLTITGKSTIQSNISEGFDNITLLLALGIVLLVLILIYVIMKL